MKNIDYQKLYSKKQADVDRFMALAQECNKADNIEHSFFVDDEYTASIHVPYAYCAFCDKELVGFLSVYKIDDYNIELCVFVHPEYRRQAIASNLFFRMVMDYDSVSYRMPIAPGNDAGESFANKMGLTFTSCEIGMALSKEDFTPIENSLVLDSAVDGENLVIDAYDGDTKVGRAIVYGTSSAACIHDVEVEEELREQGYGYAMTMAILADTFEKFDKVLLHVTKENTPALNLYKKIGFTTISQINYFEI